MNAQHTLLKSNTIQNECQIGIIKSRLQQSGVFGIAEIASEILQVAKHQRTTRLYPYDRYLLNGSSAKSTLVDEGDKHDCIVWCTNHYLGLNRHPDVIKASSEAVKKYGTGSGTSAMSGGHCELHRKLEQKIGAMLDRAVVLYPTGFTANSGSIPALFGSRDLILFDRECHASIIEGVQISGAKAIPFKHNNVEDLTKKLLRFSRGRNNVLVVCESAYSMSGNIAPLQEICELKKKSTTPFYLLVDEAHTFGIYGDHGKGLCAKLGILPQVDFITGTLSKATASLAGFLACSTAFWQLVKISARSYLFQAAMSPADAAAALASLNIISNDCRPRARVHSNNKYMRQKLREAGFDLRSSESPIIPIYVGNTERLNSISKQLFENGIFTVSVGYPAVKESQCRLRFVVNATHSRADIDITVARLADAFRAYV